MMQLHSRKITLLGLMSSIGILMGYIESLFVLPIKVPGIKLGLSNCITVLVLYLFGPIEALIVLFIRVLLSGFLFGSGYSILYSIAGAVISYLVMALFYKNKRISVVGVSVLGGVSHNIAQLFVAYLTVSSLNVFYYTPVLIISGLIAGIIVGSLSMVLINRLSNIIKGDK